MTKKLNRKIERQIARYEHLAPSEERLKISELNEGKISFEEYLSWNEDYYDIE